MATVYDTGTVSVTNGSPTVNGSGTAWNTGSPPNVRAGDDFGGDFSNHGGGGGTVDGWSGNVGCIIREEAEEGEETDNCDRTDNGGDECDGAG